MDALIEGSLDAMVLLDEEGQVVAANQALCRLAGRSRTQLVGQPLDAVGRLDPAPPRVPGPGPSLPVRGGGRLVRHDGETRDVDCLVTAFDAGRILLTLADVTDVRRAQKSADRMRRVYSVLSRANAAIFRSKDAGALFRDVCRVAVAEGGFRMAWVGMIGPSGKLNPVASAGDTGYLEGIQVSIHDVPEGRGPVGTCVRLGRHAVIDDIARDPNMRPWRDRALEAGYRSCASVPLRSSGEVVGALTLYADEPHLFEAEILDLLDALGEDISFALEADQRDKQRAEATEALLKIEEMQRLILESLPVGIFLTHADGRITYCNPAGRRIWGDARYVGLDRYGEFNGTWTRTGRRIAPHEWALARAIRKGETSIAEMVDIEAFDGVRRTILNSAVPMLQADGGIGGAIGVSEDVTEMRRLEEQVRQSQKMEAIGKLAGGVAHDFNNLLSVIIGYTEMLQRRITDPVLASKAGHVLAAAERAARLTAQLLAFSRRQVMQPRVVDVAGLITDMESLLRRLIGEDVDLVTRPDPALGTVKADPSHLEQVIMNLVVNARDAMPSGGRLIISTSSAELDAEALREHPDAAPGPYVLIEVEDTGTGMDEETCARIFEPFFTTKQPGQGTGLGLSTVYGIVKQNAGLVSVRSAPGAGTTFRIGLPRANGAATAPAAAPAEAPARGTETVLLAEDEPDLRQLVRETLEAEGYRVLEAPDGSEALALARAHSGPIHLLLSDVVMPVLSGPQLAEALKATRSETKVVFFSGYTDDALGRHGIVDAAVALLTKPFDAGQLLRAVRAALDGERRPAAPEPGGASLPAEP